MGDRGMIHFKQYGRVEAAIYTHWYGSAVDEVMIKFFQANEWANQVPDGSPREADTRYDDAAYLAARFVAHVMKDDPYGLGWGIFPPGAAEGPIWEVDCDNLVGPQKRPHISKS